MVAECRVFGDFTLSNFSPCNRGSLLWLFLILLLLPTAGLASGWRQDIGSEKPPAQGAAEDETAQAKAEPEDSPWEEAKQRTQQIMDQIKDALPDGAELPNRAGLVKEIQKVVEADQSPALIKNDAIILGILFAILALVFWTSNLESKFWKTLYQFVPMLLLCYFLPSLLTLFGVVDHHVSKLYYVATRFLLPATLVLLTLSIDLKGIFRLGPKALIMFLTGTVGVILGGPFAVLVVSWVAPDVIGVDGPEAVWRGLSTVAGSWIGGGANQAAMQGIYLDWDATESRDLYDKYRDLYSVMVAVDVIVAEIWMVFLLLGVDQRERIDRFFNADASSIETLKNKMRAYGESVKRVATTTDLMVIAAIGFGATAIGHFAGVEIADSVREFVKTSDAAAVALAAETGTDVTRGSYHFLLEIGLGSSFFWLIVLATTIGIILSFTPFKKYEGAGASKIGTVFIFVLVAVIGMQMNLAALVQHPGMFLVGGIWMAFHVGLMFLMCWLIRAPYFFLAVGSKANIGGAASAPVVAAAFHPSLAPVGVLLAVFGYALGTYGAIACAQLMQMATPSAG